MFQKSIFFTGFTILCLLTFTANATTYTVNTNSDALTGAGTAGSLRYCITQANADAATPHLIQFNIAASGVQTITLGSALPILTRSDVTIDGYTEPGASAGTFATRVFTIVIDGSAVGVGTYPFTTRASNILIRGLSLISTRSSGGAFVSIGTRSGHALFNTYSNVKFQGNIINLSPTGDAIIPAPAGVVSGAVHVYGDVDPITKVSTASNVIIGTDGDGINDEQEGNMGTPCTFSASFFGVRDVDNCVIAGNWVGLKPDGTTLVNYLPAGNASLANYPVFIANCINSRVGTNGDGVSDALERNVIADGSIAIYFAYNYTGGNNQTLSNEPLRAPGNNQATGNYIGTDVSGNVATNRINGAGIMSAANGNYIGCDLTETTNTTLRNIVSTTITGGCIEEVPHGGAAASRATWQSVTNVFKGNYIGVGADGSTALTGGWGIYHANALNSKSVQNVIGNMVEMGFYFGHNSGATANNSGVLVENNFLGVLADGVTAAANTKDNIYIDHGENITIQNNIIANSATATGIALRGGTYAGYKTQGINISQNSFYNNATLPIELYPTTGAGVSGNDGLKDATTSTTSPNLMMDYPIITSAIITGSNLALLGYVGSAPGQVIFANSRVEFYIADNSPANQNGEMILGDGLSLAHGEGRTYLGFLTTDANGNFSGTIDVTGKGVSAATELTATATDNSGNTSEFSVNYTAVVTPIKLVSFNTECKAAGVLIKWTTASETGAAYYDVEYSQNGFEWNRINRVFVYKGPSEITKEYSIIHENPSTERLFYRLKCIDVDGRFVYSPVRSSNCIVEKTLVAVYPNPASNQIFISTGNNLESNGHYELVEFTGKIIRQGKLDTTNPTIVDINDLSNGIYLVRIIQQNNTSTQKIRIINIF